MGGGKDGTRNNCGNRRRSRLSPVAGAYGPGRELRFRLDCRAPGSGPEPVLQLLTVAAAQRQARAGAQQRPAYSPFSQGCISWMRSMFTMRERWMRKNFSGSSRPSIAFMVSRSRCDVAADVQPHVVAGRLDPVDFVGAQEEQPAARLRRPGDRCAADRAAGP